MNIHEYQAKSLLKSFGAPVADGGVAMTPVRPKPPPRICPARYGW